LLHTIKNQFNYKAYRCLSIGALSQVYKYSKNYYIVLGFVLIFSIYTIPVVGIAILIFGEPNPTIVFGALVLYILIALSLIASNLICMVCINKISKVDTLKLIRYKSICDVINEIDLQTILTTNPKIKRKNIKTLYYLKDNIDYILSGLVDPVHEKNLNIDDLTMLIREFNVAYQNIEAMLIVLQNS
jgi:hypothetical protein